MIVVVIVVVIVMVAMALSWTKVVLFSDERTKERPSLEYLPRQIKSVLPLPTVRTTKPMSMSMCNRRNNHRRRPKYIVVAVVVVVFFGSLLCVLSFSDFVVYFVCCIMNSLEFCSGSL